MTNKSSSLKAFTKLFGFCAGGVLLTSAVTASAASPANFSPVQVEYPGKLLVQDPQGVNYYAQLTSPCTGIAANSIDTIKIWQSLAQSALLSNKNVTLYYTTCSGGTTNYITDIVLRKN